MAGARVDSFTRALAAALAFHAGPLGVAILSAQISPELGTEGEPPEFAAAELVDLEINSSFTGSSEPPLQAELSEVSSPRRSLTGAAPRGTEFRGSRSHRPDSSTNSQPAQGTIDSQLDTPPPGEQQTEIAEKGLTESVPLSLVELGLEGPNRLSLRSAEPKPVGVEERPLDEHEAAARVMRSMRRLANEHDRKVGLGAGGGVASALQKATYETRNIPNGRATFEIVVREGVVSSITLVPDGVQNANAWNEVATAALTRLSGRRMHLPTGGKGLVMHVRVESRSALPSGHDPGLEISVGPVVVQRGRGKRSARLSFLEPGLQLISAIDLPGMGGGTRVPAPGAAITLVRTNIDPVDFVAKERQVVHAYTMDETPLD